MRIAYLIFYCGTTLFTSIQPEAGWKWVGDHIRPRVRVPERWHVPVGLSLSTEIGYQQRSFSTATWTIEIRPILDKQWGPWYASFNPVFERSLKGEGTNRGFAFSPNAKLSYAILPKVSAGLEYLGGSDRSRPLTHSASSSTCCSQSLISTSGRNGNAMLG